MNLRQDIQALRGLAVLLVVVHHAEFGLVDAGYLGVDVFFVVSGFLITGLITSRIESGRFTDPSIGPDRGLTVGLLHR